MATRPTSLQNTLLSYPDHTDSCLLIVCLSVNSSCQLRLPAWSRNLGCAPPCAWPSGPVPPPQPSSAALQPLSHAPAGSCASPCSAHACKACCAATLLHFLQAKRAMALSTGLCRIFCARKYKCWKSQAQDTRHTYQIWS